VGYQIALKIDLIGAAGADLCAVFIRICAKKSTNKFVPTILI
jgi:hypothetical protein